jgi:hypothetical protein
LIEVMVSMVILIVCMLGFIAMMQHVLASNATAHRRTVGSFTRGALLDQLAVTPRRVLGTVPANQWLVDECYDIHARTTGTNQLRTADYTCPDTSYYRRWLRVAPLAGVTNAFDVGVYVERIDNGCTPETRGASVGCVAADLFVTD